MMSAANINNIHAPAPVNSAFPANGKNNSFISVDRQDQNQRQEGYDKVTISETGKRRAFENSSQNPAAEKQNSEIKPERNNSEPSSEELRAIQKLHQRDREVRAHEQAHLANAGQYARGGASYSYTTGPDGKRYASGGEVPIDISKERTPAETIQKMQAVRRAALAPANPSGADRNIAASASKKEAEARSELQEEMTSKGQAEGLPDSLKTQNQPSADSNRSIKPGSGSTSEISSFKAETFPQ